MKFSLKAKVLAALVVALLLVYMNLVSAIALVHFLAQLGTAALVVSLFLLIALVTGMVRTVRDIRGAHA